MIFILEILVGLFIISQSTVLPTCNTFDFIDDSQDFKDCLKQRFDSPSTYSLMPPKENVTKYGLFSSLHFHFLLLSNFTFCL